MNSHVEIFIELSVWLAAVVMGLGTRNWLRRQITNYVNKTVQKECSRCDTSITAYSLVHGYQCFRKTFFFHLQG
jgi:hypothetical protein